MDARRNNTKLGDVLACKKDFTPLNVTIISLDGTPYLQTTGTATQRRSVSLYCDTEAKRVATDNAANDGALISIEWNGSTLYGYIDGKITWKEWKDEHGVGKFNFLVREVIE